MSQEQLQADGWLTDERTVHEDMDKYAKDVQRGCFHTQSRLTFSTDTHSRSWSYCDGLGSFHPQR